MLRRVISSLLAAVALAALLAPAASADEPLKQGLEGSFALKATNGYKLSALIGSTGEGDAGLLILSVAKKGSGATYLAHGEVTKEHVALRPRQPRPDRPRGPSDRARRKR